MSRLRFLWMAVPFVAIVALTVGAQQAQAQAGTNPLYPPGIGFNPAVDYTAGNFAYSPNIRKFVDSLPGLNAANKNNLGQYIPVAIPDTTTYPGCEYYVLAARQFSSGAPPFGTPWRMNTDLPATGTLLRGYSQINTTDATVANISQYLGPAIIAKVYDPTKPAGVNGNGKPVRVLFKNLLPTSATTAGNLFLPWDSTLMGAGMGPTTGVNYTQNRVTIPHLHGGRTPWISDGTPHQWLTPAGDPSPYSKGASVVNVPDMVGTGKSIPTPTATDGMSTLYWTNEQSGRLMFFHDHLVGATRLNVYAGLAAPYLLVDPVEEDLIAGTNATGGNPSVKQILPDQSGIDKSATGNLYRYGIPLVIQDKAFVNDASTPPGPNFPATYVPTKATTDPTQDPLWATYVKTTGGNLWFPHEYMPIENIFDPTGNTPNGRWDYAPFMIPPMPALNLTLPSPTCVPEAFGDTAIVNGTAFPYLELPPDTIRFRILSVGNDRVLNLQVYKAEPLTVRVSTRGSGYTAPTVTLAGGGGTYTSAAAIVSTGEISDVSVTGSENYIFPPTVTLTGGGGTYTSAQATLAANTHGTIDSIVVRGATGYTSAPTVTITGGGGGAYTSAVATIIPPGAIKDVVVIGAAGYTSNPTVAITDAGAGAGATAFAVANTEVTMVPASPNADYPSWPADGRDGGVPDPTTQGPPWILIGNESGLLAQCAVLPQQPIGFEYNRQSIPLAGITDKALLMLPAMRADVLLDLRGYKDGDVLIVYNDAPAPAPNYWPINDFYTDDPDQTGVGAAPSTPPGFGPNTRTIMQIRIKGTKTTAFNFDLAALQATLPAAFSKSQDKPLVPQLAYNDAYPGFATSNIYMQSIDSTLNITGKPGPVTWIKTTAPGNNYTTAPQVVIVGGGGTGAAGTAALNPCGMISLLTAGTGYTSAPTVTIGAPGAGGVQCTATATISGGGVSAINIVEPGSNYSTTVAPTVTLAGGGGTGATASALVATANTVGSIKLTSGGSGYTHQPMVYLVDQPGIAGVGASAVALITGAVPMTSKNITEGFDPDYGRMDIRMGSTPNPLTPSVGAGLVLGLARYIDPPTEILNDGETTLWRITHLGVDSHALHFHLFDVQVINRVDWTNVVKPPYPEEIGWRDTIRTNPLEDICVAFKPHSMTVPFVVPNSNRLLDPSTPANSTINFLPVAPPAGVAAVAQVANVMTNFGWEYVFHCHMLGHEDNDFMRPMVLNVVPPPAPTGLTASTGASTTTAKVTLSWTNPVTTVQINGVTIQRATNTGFTTGLTTFTAVAGTTVYTDTTPAWNTRYYYRVALTNAAGNSAWSNVVNLTTPKGAVPLAPTNLAAGTLTTRSVVLTWTINGANTGVVIQRAANAAFTGTITTTTVNTANLATRTMTGLRTKTTYYYRVMEKNANGNSAASNVLTVTTP